MGARIDINSPVNFKTNYYFGLSQPKRLNQVSPILKVSPGGNVYDLTGYLNFLPKVIRYAGQNLTVHEATIPQKAKALFQLPGRRIEVVVDDNKILPYQNAESAHQVFFMTSTDACKVKKRLDLEIAAERQEF